MTPSTTVAAAPPATFADLGLPAVLVQALRRDGIEMPFPIQAATTPDVLAGKDVLGRGPTGSGKTLAFGLPMLTRLAGRPAKPGRPRGLVLVPTRELAAQIERALDEPALALGLRVASVVGGAPIKRQADRLARGVDLLIATPGRLADLLAQKSADLSDVTITALDEADHMADMGFLPQVTKLLDRTPRDGQRLLFSATLDGEVDKLVKRYLRSPVTHSTAPPSASVATMSHHLLYVGDKVTKRAVATEIAAREGLTIMFVRTKHGADRLAKQLRAAGIPTGALHGGKAQNNRTRTLAAFADGSVPVLVTTDVAARGIHVDGISLVVHVDPPPEPKAYLHRAGRTARAGEDGVVVTLVMDEERREVEAMARKAGVEVDGVAVRPGDRALVKITGARRPSGVPVVPASAAPVAAQAPEPARRRANRRSETAPAGGRGAGAVKQSRSGSVSGRGESVTAPGRRRGHAKVAGKPAAGNTAGYGASSGEGASTRRSGAAGGFSGRAAASGSGDTPGRPRRRAVRAQQSPQRGNRGAN
ncbi:DEAD/DEAH box helicase [Nocardia sp. CDC186]|uniref:DEAD/DEAH box helicase n=1 Tax=Nocardia implantans TaxID=3108168 RepID=A0ABU6ARM6_9NOCA|nr:MULTISPECIES: DEAD/DEAH box helicase [unclassified Nocardia]MBF6191420.1 DEAD/DEAH box helicase [Nocardia beijingensis]MEA3528273.1 DEAD/DEAH box helicase [Nocardia sp. CDC192]MEB3509977.1 DEAD/DEAH box helicase [Nocardia sp. CDC186]